MQKIAQIPSQAYQDKDKARVFAYKDKKKNLVFWDL